MVSMYQQATHFTIYHEIAHLIQKSKYLNSALYEFAAAEADFDYCRHLYELDADLFAALNIGSHILQYAKGTFGDGLKNEHVEKLIVIICSSSLFYFLFFQSDVKGMYYEEKTHPHPVIRVSLVIFHLVSYLQEVYQRDGKRFDLNF